MFLSNLYDQLALRLPELVWRRFTLMPLEYLRRPWPKWHVVKQHPTASQTKPVVDLDLKVHVWRSRLT